MELAYTLRIGGVSVASKSPRRWTRGYSLSEYAAYLWAKERAYEGTRTPGLLQLLVIIHALQGFAEACKTRISKPLSFLWLAARCTVLRSRWCQSGIKMLSVIWLKWRRKFVDDARRFLCQPDPL